MSEQQTDNIDEPEVGADLSFRERALRDLFVNEYLVDYNEYAAAIRIGYSQAYAKEYSVRFMNEPYVLQQIRLKENAPTPDDSVEDMKKRVMTGLIREANYRGPGCSQSARVAALSKLAAIHGMDAPIRSKTEITGADGQPLNGGVFVIPGVMTVEQWEAAAAEQQTALVNGTPAA